MRGSDADGVNGHGVNAEDEDPSQANVGAKVTVTTVTPFQELRFRMTVSLLGQPLARGTSLSHLHWRVTVTFGDDVSSKG